MNSKSKSKNPTPPIRAFGQRSIASIFRSFPPDSSRDSESSARNHDSHKNESMHVTPSHCKLQQSSQPPKTVPGKLTPFLCMRIPADERTGNVKQVEEEKHVGTANDKVIMDMFKHTKEEGISDFIIPIDVDELENSVADDIQESRKRKNPYEEEEEDKRLRELSLGLQSCFLRCGCKHENQTVRNHVVVLGGESRLKPKIHNENGSGNKKPRPCNSEASVRNQTSRESESTHASLLHFIDCKLSESSPTPQTVPWKSNPFLSSLGSRIPMGEQAGNEKQTEKEKNGATLDSKVIIDMFKHTKEGKGDFVSPMGGDELENLLADDIQESGRWNNPFEGGNENQTVRNHVVVLGGGSRLKPKRQMKSDSGNKKKPLYDHYKNGRGWWDYDMEGVDNEELGFSEVWEGVGSTTLGGIVDWH